MIRLIGVLAFLVILVGLLVWAVPKDQVISSAVPATGALLNSAILEQAQLDTSTANAQETATADILQAHNRATFSAATATQSAAQTQAMLAETQGQFNLRLTADSATERAGATATQQRKDESAASTTTAIAGVISTQTQSVIATQQGHADQVRQSEVQQQDNIAFLWAWGPPLFLLAVVAVCGWVFWYWEIHKRVRPGTSRELAAPVFADRDPPLYELPLPKAEVVIDPSPITEPDGEVSGWLEEVKEMLLASEKEDQDDPNA